jgi:hypothetical protein
MKVRIVSALLLLTMLAATAADARPCFTYNIGYPTVVKPGIAAPCVSYYPPYYYRHRRWYPRRHYWS